MSYRILSPSLHTTADAASAIFRGDFGFSRLKIEEPFDSSIQFRPTFHCSSNDYHYVCIEVSEVAFPARLDALIAACMTRCLPVLLYVVIRDATEDKEFTSNLKKAKQLGVGVVEVNSKDYTVYAEPVSLSLAGVRQVEYSGFSPKYRQVVRKARETFVTGDPEKGSQRIYEEIEALTREIASVVTRNGWWKGAHPTIQANTGWYKVARFLHDELNFNVTGCSLLTQPLVAQIMGSTRNRNIVSHKPDSRKKLIARNYKLRTIFESGVDLLQEVLEATKSIR